jgi:hypothetical protein
VDQSSPEHQINLKPDRTHNDLMLAAKECSDVKSKEASPFRVKSIKYVNRLSQSKLEAMQDLKI